MKLSSILSSLTLAAAVGLAATFAVGAADKPKLTVKEVMKDFHKGDDALCKKVVAGKASKEELKKMVAAYTDMCAQKAPKGDEKAWKEIAGKLCAAAKGVEEGKPGAVEAYKVAINCKTCHSAHKPD